ncbi:MAG: outer membrane protein assembly factor BamA [Candidatus Omnitrophota bacterium]
MRKLLLLFLSFLVILSAYAADDSVIARVDIKGHNRVSDATIISKIKIRAGQAYNENIVNEDIKNLYATGFFETVEAEKEKIPEGIVVTFKVKEKPVLSKLIIEGAHFIREKKIEEAIEIKAGSFVDEYKLNDVASKIKDLYAKKGFTQTKITYDFNIAKDKNEAEVKFIIEEKGVLKVRSVKIQGSKIISAGRILKLMKTRPAWLFNAGLYKEETFADDIKRITDFYRQEGFTDVKIEPNMDFNEKGLYITIIVTEGKRYYLGNIQFEGYKDITLNEIKKAAKLKGGSVYSEQALYEESSRIRSVYVDKGYIFAQIDPTTLLNPETQKIDVIYKIVENQVAYIERIDIKGNIKTKDKVIRRELRFYPKERFDGKAVKKSKEKLENLGFFEEVRFDTEPGTKPDEVNLTVDVKEAKTGHLSFGGGYSSIEEFVGFVEIRQTNFDYTNFSTFSGGGQDLSLYGSLGSLTNRYELSFTNPWIFDRPYSFGFDAYKKGHKQDEDVGYGYSEDIVGGDLRLGKNFTEDLKGQISYRYDRVKISDVIDNATSDLKDETGTNNLSSGAFDLAYDTRDNVFSPLTGIYFVNNLQVTGGPFGGSKDFVKYFGRFSYFYPFINKSVLEGRLRVGWADPFSDTKKVPIYERFFAGGANTIRGYQERKAGPVDPATNDPLGGESMFVANLEYTYPVVDFLKVATFFDAGNVWAKNSDFFSDKLFKSIGLGVRVKTPIGPVSVDYGWPLDLEPGTDHKEGRFHFNVSRGF